MKFESWDPDITELQNVTGPCVKGTKFMYIMADGAYVPCSLTDVQKYKSITFEGLAISGSMGFIGKIILTPKSQAHTGLKYVFGLKGCMGTIITLFNSGTIRQGMEKGLENMVRLSEEANRAEGVMS